ncbi:MAG: hypothetical protein SGPRY_007123 [Prymnesium sp.]
MWGAVASEQFFLVVVRDDNVVQVEPDPDRTINHLRKSLQFMSSDRRSASSSITLISQLEVARTAQEASERRATSEQERADEATLLAQTLQEKLEIAEKHLMRLEQQLEDGEQRTRALEQQLSEANNERGSEPLIVQQACEKLESDDASDIHMLRYMLSANKMRVYAKRWLDVARHRAVERQKNAIAQTWARDHAALRLALGLTHSSNQ